MKYLHVLYLVVVRLRTSNALRPTNTVCILSGLSPIVHRETERSKFATAQNAEDNLSLSI